MKRILASALLLGLALPTGTGCTASYWQSFVRPTQATVSPVSEAKVDWKETKTQQDGAEVRVWTSTLTPPVLQVDLLQKSADLELESLQVEYLSQVPDENGQLVAIAGVNTLSFPYRRIIDETTTLTMHEIMTNELVAATKPDNNPVPDIRIVARFTFTGRTAFGARTTLITTAPIIIASTPAP